MSKNLLTMRNPKTLVYQLQQFKKKFSKLHLMPTHAYLLTFFLILLNGCSGSGTDNTTKLIEKDNSNLSNKEFFIIKTEIGQDGKFGIAAVRDINSPNRKFGYYIVAAPLRSNIDFEGMNDLRLNSSVPIMVEDADKFLNVINEVIDNWDKTDSLNESKTFRFSPTPNQDFIDETNAASDWYPFLRFYFDMGKNVKEGRLLIGPKMEEYYKFLFNEIIQLKRLKDQLSRAIEKIESWKIDTTN